MAADRDDAIPRRGPYKKKNTTQHKINRSQTKIQLSNYYRHVVMTLNLIFYRLICIFLTGNASVRKRCTHAYKLAARNVIDDAKCLFFDATPTRNGLLELYDFRFLCYI